jgi:hypothetical protein
MDHNLLKNDKLWLNLKMISKSKTIVTLPCKQIKEPQSKLIGVLKISLLCLLITVLIP